MCLECHQQRAAVLNRVSGLGGGQGDRGPQGAAQGLPRQEAAEGTDAEATEVARIEGPNRGGCHGEGTWRPGGEGRAEGGIASHFSP